MPANQFTAVDEILISVNNNISHSDSNIFQLFTSLNCDQSSINMILPIQVNYGKLNLDLAMTSDQNGNLIIEPGETASYTLNVINNGFIELNDLVLTLQDLSDLQISYFVNEINQLNINESNQDIPYQFHQISLRLKIKI